MSYNIGIDLGGTNLRIAGYRDLQDAGPGNVPEPLVLRRSEVGHERDVKAISRVITERVAEVREALGAGAEDCPVGIGFAGMLRGDAGFVVNSPHFGWRNVDFRAELIESLTGPLVIENDVNVIALAESRLGSAAGATDVLAVLAGTGIGGGIIAGGKLVTGLGAAGEFGHMKVVTDDSARPCHCGKRGCIEAYVGGRNLRDRIHHELSRRFRRSLAVTIAGGLEMVEVSHVDQAAAQGDEYAISLYDEIAPLLGLSLANAVTLLSPSHLVLGGGVLSRTPVLKEQALATMVLAANAPALDQLHVVDTALGDEAGLIGAALLALPLAS